MVIVPQQGGYVISVGGNRFSHPQRWLSRLPAVGHGHLFAGCHNGPRQNDDDGLRGVCGRYRTCVYSQTCLAWHFAA